MTKLSRRKLEPDKITLLINQLWRAMTLLETKDEVRKFLRDLLTRTEVQMLARRLEVVKMLDEGYTYDLISKRLNMSEATIARLSESTQSSGEGYRLIIERLQAIERSREKDYEKKYIISGQVRAATELWKGVGKAVVKKYKVHRKRKSAQV